MADQAGFRIGDEFYPFPDNYRIGDSVLIEMVTGLDMEEFSEILSENQSSARVFAGLIGVAVWRAHPRWDVTKAARFVQELDLSSIATEGPDDPGEEEDPPSPPQIGGGASEDSGSGSSEPAAPSEPLPAFVSEQ